VRRPSPPSPDGLPIGRRVAMHRAALGISSQELAARAGISASQLSRIEHGRHDPAWSTVERLYRALGWELREVMIGGPDHNEAA
jgi:predicted transcriptional regulator